MNVVPVNKGETIYMNVRRIKNNRCLVLFICMVILSVFLVGCSGKGDAKELKRYKTIDNKQNSICMITDSGNIDDGSFNQTSYEAGKNYAGKKGLTFACKRPDSSSDKDRNSMIDIAVKEGYEILLMSGYQCASSVIYTANTYPEIKVLGIDISEDDLLQAALGDEYSGNKSDYRISDYVNMKNVYCVTFKEEQAGFLAGYMAVKSGYRRLGFLGGMECAAVSNYGYGFIQGADCAAISEGSSGAVKVDYYYTGSFSSSPEITAYAKKMYYNGCDVIFSCGGGICESAATACYQLDKKVIGVDVDQKAFYDSYEEGMVITSALKGIGQVIESTLDDIVENGCWDERAGKIERLGIESEEAENFVELSESTEYSDTFTVDDYKKVVSDIYNDKIKITNVNDERPEVKIEVSYLNDLYE